MKIIKTTRNLILVTLVLSTQVYSFEQTEPEAINKKDIVDEIGRSEIEGDEQAETPKIENMMPAFEIPQLKVNIEKVKSSSASSTKSNTVKKDVKNPVKKGVNEPVKQTNTNVSKVTKKPKNTAKRNDRKNKPHKRKVIAVQKYLKPSQLLLQDMIILKKGKVFVERSKGKYIYKYRYKQNVPLQSKGLALIKPNNYMIVDKELLIEDTNTFKESEKPSNEINTVALSDEHYLKRKELEKKFNNGKPIQKAISITDLYRDDIIYKFGDIQIVTRKSGGKLSSTKYWLVPIIDLTHPALYKLSKGKYKVRKRIK